MRERSTIWKELAASGNFSMDIKAVIGGVEYTAISAPTIESGLMTNALSVGNCISASMKLSVLTDDIIPKSADVIIKMRLNNGSTYSEWLQLNPFYIDRRNSRNGLYTLQCYDAMMKTRQKYVDSSLEDDRIGWPKSMRDCVNEISGRIGVELDERTIINTHEAYQVDYPTEYTMQEVLGYIGAAHGGNWIITPDNKLRLVPLVSPQRDSNATHPVGGELVPVPVIVGKITRGDTVHISRVTIGRDSSLGYTNGDDSGAELRITENPYACQKICDDLYESLLGTEYTQFEASGACFDPCAELGDWVVIGSQINGVIYHQTLKFGANFGADISTPGKAEASSEYPFLTQIERTKRADKLLEVYLDKAKREIDSSILQTYEQILLVVSDKYSTKTEVHNSITSTFTQLSDEISIKLSRVTETIEGVNGDLQSRLNEVTKHFSFTIDGMTIGAVNNPNTVVIDNDEISILRNGVIVHTFNANGESVSPDAKITERQNLIGYLTEMDDEGNLNTWWVGE